MAKRRKCRDCGQPVEGQSHRCPQCKLEHHRETARRVYRNMRQDPERLAAYLENKANYRARHKIEQASYYREYLKRLRADEEAAARRRETLIESKRRAHERLRKSPQKWAEYLELHRIDSRLRAERQGRTPTPPVAEPPPDPETSADRARWIDVAPVTRLLNEYAAHYGATSLDPKHRGWDLLEAESGIAARRIYEYAKGRQRWINYAIADRLLVALGTTLSAHYDLAKKMRPL